MRNLFFGCNGNLSIVSKSLFYPDVKNILWSLELISQSNDCPRYKRKDSPVLTGFTDSLFKCSFGWICLAIELTFLMPNEWHLSTRMIIFAQLHQRLKAFNKIWFSLSRQLTAAASSANWNQWAQGLVLQRIYNQVDYNNGLVWHVV